MTEDKTKTDELKALVDMLSIEDREELDALFAKAREVRADVSGDIVYLRGLVELSNICVKDCFYCGIRTGNAELERYQLRFLDVLNACRWAEEWRFGSVVLQAGERQDKVFVDWVERLVSGIREQSEGRLRITLAVGEQSRDVYQRWIEAGAERYLLRVETSNPDLYQKLHPVDHSFDTRVRCLRDLKELGYQVGTGVMIGLPGQTLEDLARDILFFKEIDADMIGMGPYLYHGKTPMGEQHGEPDPDRQLALGLKMLAATRIHLGNVNLAATTALEALVPNGKELGIYAGANVVMPNLTETCYRGAYCLYDGKPGTESNATQSLEHLSLEIEKAGCEIGWDAWGDAPHFAVRMKEGAVQK